MSSTPIQEQLKRMLDINALAKMLVMNIYDRGDRWRELHPPTSWDEHYGNAWDEGDDECGTCCGIDNVIRLADAAGVEIKLRARISYYSKILPAIRGSDPTPSEVQEAEETYLYDIGEHPKQIEEMRKKQAKRKAKQIVDEFDLPSQMRQLVQSVISQ